MVAEFNNGIKSSYIVVRGWGESSREEDAPKETTRRIIFADSESDCKEYSFREFDKAQE